MKTTNLDFLKDQLKLKLAEANLIREQIAAQKKPKVKGKPIAKPAPASKPAAKRKPTQKG